ncbi:PQQ-binding-like beta-propeller repeat protein [Dactylosporangium fulvum]|uniref:PQQ-binding-like beta-propeller repeat protein n=1 Tax=Dactylosporangium fulvum TaxID=53359 RepID=A0ABY5W7B6_9ACTN|nr:PQQ-binding-like beta-propeller repeat protein [Dactylosporangium fulvum]UWP85344.1 PQQ-binding-like beta-propeller repeat protein [Dactylosporangium fulvum]
MRESGSVPDGMIELDLTVPWEPPEASHPPRVRAARRWIALAAVALVIAGMVAASVPRTSTDPVLTIDGVRVLNAAVRGGRVIVELYQPEGAGRRVEVLSLRDGTRLWSMGLGIDQHLTFLTDNVMALTADLPAGSPHTLTVLDAATGERLWQRTRLSYLGQAAGRILAEDRTGVADEPLIVADLAGEIPTYLTMEQHDQRYLALDERTGATVWEVRVPKGSVADFNWFDAHSGPTVMSELSPTGVLRLRDLGTGAVIATHQLDWSGTISSFTTGGPLLRSGTALPDQVLIDTVGERGTDVYDRATGRLLWHWQDNHSNGRDDGSPYPCTAELFCRREESGLTAVDPRTGARLWHLDRYNGVLDHAGDTLVVGVWGPGGNAQPVATVDARTGRVVRELEGWELTAGLPGSRLVVWKPADDRTAVLGVADPRSGRITVFGRVARWHGRPDCFQDRGMFACVIDGALSVWRLP